MPAAAHRRDAVRDAEWFIGELRALSAGNLRALWLPAPTDATTNSLRPDGRVWTNSATIQGRITHSGNGVLVTFTAASSHTSSTPDTASLSVGNGTTDGALTLVALANVTNTTSARALIGKTSGGATYEYILQVTADANPRGADRLECFLYDQSSGGIPIRTSDAAVTMGSIALFGVSYSAATGGATAANDITLYQNGAVIASTAANSAGYVAMEDTAALGYVGSDGGAQGFMSGSIGFGAIFSIALTTAQHRQIANLCNEFYGVAI